MMPKPLLVKTYSLRYIMENSSPNFTKTAQSKPTPIVEVIRGRGGALLEPLIFSSGFGCHATEPCRQAF
jgi:hypothetical protein